MEQSSKETRKRCHSSAEIRNRGGSNIEEIFEASRESFHGDSDKKKKKREFHLFVYLQHMFYAQCENRTSVDISVERLIASGKLRAVRIGLNADETALVDLEEFEEHCTELAKDKKLMRKFFELLVRNSSEMVYSRLQINESLNETEVTELIRMGVLTITKEVGFYWLSIPQASKFVRELEKGRKSLLLTMKKMKFKQMLREDMVSNVLKRCSFSAEFLTADAIGKDVLERINTTTGSFLRLKEE